MAPLFCPGKPKNPAANFANEREVSKPFAEIRIIRGKEFSLTDDTLEENRK